MKIITVLILLALVFTGCVETAKQPTAGVVESAYGLAVGNSSPDLFFKSEEGKQTKFRKVSEPISIIAFICPTGQECCLINSDLAAIAEKFKDEFITVAQISLPTSDCPHGAGCVEVCNLFDKNLFLLCDKDRIAWRAYRQPEPDTVFLINQDNKIVAISCLNNLREIENKAMELSDEITEAADEVYQR